MEELLRQGLTALGLPPESAPDLARYGEMLREKNRVMNLTAIEDPAEIAALHFLDSAALLTLADFRNKARCGCGHRRRLSRAPLPDSGALPQLDPAGRSE